MRLKRLGALFYDLLTILALLLTFTAICITLNKGRPIQPETLWFQMALLLIIYTYYSVSCKLAGQTIGMRAWRIQLVSLEKSLKHKQLFFRFCLTPLFLFSGFIFRTPEKFIKKMTKTEYRF
ncbi:RDD family (plasmid) [Legionella adelaidensis]|uniref:RDD family n=1 Tax=Legionella adelaidensis TaxID=45056 RepID=A0A0W0R5Y6_9GAMM|nr:RDD family protein [Legionella adelaidensis]KTC66464.1 RDD family protein [Legionella adelaidensis]VEH86248.1 RDD family [Legionella adelaidensis]